jgi:hypothetical protein
VITNEKQAPPGGAAEDVTRDNVVHIYDAGFPLCFTERRENPGLLWKDGSMVRQRALANCPDCRDL